ncbi:MAG: nitrate ABC transporter substrate-binding protein, partial [Candidatus Thiodiazotropha weberae]|nr:nitrate ABC transporter substrate-binding protein [Candidatus Thiodiazotropha lotti]MCW4212593.1 nitrate ABC transporter substrate-binding protein [Candidatus Thiodiazotropha lotti]
AANPNTHQAVITALIKACEWIDQAENRKEVCELLSQGRYVNAPQEILEKSMLGTFQFSRDEAAVERADFNVFNRYSANFPWRSHAIWFLTQMVRWGQLRDPFDLQRIAKLVYQPEIYRKAAASLAIDLPQADIKPEGIHGEAWQLAGEQHSLAMGSDLFFDGNAFDPEKPIDYLKAQPVSNLGCSIEALLQANPSKRSLSPDTERLTEEASQ